MTDVEVLQSLQACHAMVWATRGRLAKTAWTTPPADTALKFAVTEAGEALQAAALTLGAVSATIAMDAMLREVGGFARNSDREMSVNAELADTAMMLLTAMGRELTPAMSADWIQDEIDFLFRDNKPITITAICSFVTDTALALEEGNVKKVATLRDSALVAIACYPGLDLRAELAERLERLERKHGRHATVQHEYAANSRQYAAQLAAGTIGGPVAEDVPVCSQ